VWDAVWFIVFVDVHIIRINGDFSEENAWMRNFVTKTRKKLKAINVWRCLNP
jgi:hypothetical protein